MITEEFITEPSEIHKSDIEHLGACIGKVNGVAWTVGDTVYEPGTLAFRGFAGSIRLSDGMYVGVHRYAQVEADPSNETFLSLPGAGSVAPQSATLATDDTQDVEGEVD